MHEMQQSLSRFSGRLLELRDTLTQQKKLVRQEEEQVFALLEQLASELDADKLDSNCDSRGVEDNALRKTVDSVFHNLTTAIRAWKKEMTERSEVREKLEEMGSGLIVVVFGRTNAGKSTLGNFLRGKQLRNALFDNDWKNGKIPLSPIAVIEKGTEAEQNSDMEWFAEGGVETTREAQLFQMPGMLWLDTPGFGSMNDSTLGSLARKYVKGSDLIVYLDDSDNPGLQSITANLVAMLKEGRSTLIAINHSDKNERVKTTDGKTARDANGKILQRRVAKADEDRQRQEEYLTECLAKDLPDSKIRAISISMLLAMMAVEENDDAMYKASNVDALFSQILDLIPDNNAVSRLKYRDALRKCVTLIDMALGENASKQKTLRAFDEQIATMLDHVEQADKDFDIENETKMILAATLPETRDKIKKLVMAAKEANPSGKSVSIDINPLTDSMAEAIILFVREKAKKLLKDLWLDMGMEISTKMTTIGPATLTRQEEKHVYEVTETERYERSPDGIIEHICSWCGKKYYGSQLVTRKKEQIIDLGFNVEEIFSMLCKQVEDAFYGYVRDEMTNIRQECIVRGGEMLRTRRNIILSTIDELEKHKKELLQKIDA